MLKVRKNIFRITIFTCILNRNKLGYCHISTLRFFFLWLNFFHKVYYLPGSPTSRKKFHKVTPFLHKKQCKTEKYGPPAVCSGVAVAYSNFVACSRVTEWGALRLCRYVFMFFIKMAAFVYFTVSFSITDVTSVSSMRFVKLWLGITVIQWLNCSWY